MCTCIYVCTYAQICILGGIGTTFAGVQQQNNREAQKKVHLLCSKRHDHCVTFTTQPALRFAIRH